ncbi:MAG: ribonuclease H-like domain-containing protein [Deltaproteobacteria bacterium]|nr:ribonuclease H-like domain-containing protein [Deltaproteobacteria bacterium]
MSMLERTFIHLPGVGPNRERRFWASGIVTWYDFLEKGEKRLSSSLYRRLAPLVERSIEKRDHPSYFSSLIEPAERWRLYSAFPDKAFLDIETYGCNGADEVTVVGIFDGVRYQPFVQGANLERFQDTLKRTDVVVTFNGARFDLPFLENSFPGFRLEAAHIDLMHACRKLGLRGGLKKIERYFGIERPASVAGMDGYGAVRLWRAYLDGDARALELLILYNQEDTVNLKRIMDRTEHLLTAELPIPP